MFRLSLFVSLILTMAISSDAIHAHERSKVVLTPEAMRIHRSALLVDGHNDFPGKVRGKYGFDLKDFDFTTPNPDFHTDIPRLIEGGVGAQFWVSYVPASFIKNGGAAKHAFEQIDLIKRFVTGNPQALEMAYSTSDIERIRHEGKIASLIGVEGGHALENSVGVLRTLYEVGARYLTLTHSDTIDWADSATDDPKHDGLNELGEQIILEMNRLGMLVDISHVSADAMRDALRISKAPIIASHSSAFSLAQTARNVPDDVLKEVAKNNGVVMVNFYPAFISNEGAKRVQEMFSFWRNLQQDTTLSEDEKNKRMDEYDQKYPTPPTTVHDVVDHIEHIINIAGIEHVGIGSDYDGISAAPEQLEDVSKFPYITQELLNRGYGEPDITKILGGNFMRAFRAVERVAERMQNTQKL